MSTKARRNGFTPPSSLKSAALSRCLAEGRATHPRADLLFNPVASVPPALSLHPRPRWQDPRI